MTKQLRHCHSERSEESLILFVATGARRKKSEMFRFAQHDRIMVGWELRMRNARLLRVQASSLIRHSTFGFRHFATALQPRSHMLDHVVPKLRALDLRCAVHQAREVVRDSLAFDRAA